MPVAAVNWGNRWSNSPELAVEVVEAKVMKRSPA
jgi:hypothetical protein